MKQGFALALAACSLAASMGGCASGYTGVGGDLKLNLPEAYAIEYQVHEEYILSKDYTQSMVCCPEGYSFVYGDTQERQMFRKLDSSKYLQYYYDPFTGDYRSQTITPDVQDKIDAGLVPVDNYAVSEQVVAGYASRMRTAMEMYSFAKDYLTLTGTEQVQGVPCSRYAVDAEGTTWGKVKGTFWIAADTGICMKGEYDYTLPNGTVGTKSIVCTRWETGNLSLPDV